MYNSDAYQVLELKLYKTTEDLDKVHLTRYYPEIVNNQYYQVVMRSLLSILEQIQKKSMVLKHLI